MTRKPGRPSSPPAPFSALLGAILMIVAPAPVLAQSEKASGDADALQRQHQQLDQQRRSLEQSRGRQTRLEQSAAELRRETAQINTRLIKVASEIQKREARLTGIEARLQELNARREKLSDELASQHKKLAALLATLQRMGRNPPPAMATRRDDALAMVRSAMMLASLFPDLRDKAQALADKLGKLETVLAEIRSEGEQLRQENQELMKSRESLQGLMAAKKARLEETQTALVEVRRAVEQHRKSVTNLNDLIGRFDQTVRDKAGLGEYEEELARGEAPGQDEPAASPDNDDAVVVKPSTRELAMRNPDRMKPSIPFASARGRLPFPAQGRRLVSYNEETRYGGKSKGITIETRGGAQITSPNDGWVVYAGPFRSYGQLLIINAGQGYHVVLAGLDKIDVVVGQFVLSGEPVGNMKPALRRGQDERQQAAPILYVEFRQNGRPIDPDPWWADGSKKVQG